MAKVPIPAKAGKSLYTLPVAELPAKMIAELAAMPCVCDVIKAERRPCTSCRARSAKQAPQKPGSEAP